MSIIWRNISALLSAAVPLSEQVIIVPLRSTVVELIDSFDVSGDVAVITNINATRFTSRGETVRAILEDEIARVSERLKFGIVMFHSKNILTLVLQVTLSCSPGHTNTSSVGANSNTPKRDYFHYCQTVYLELTYYICKH